MTGFIQALRSASESLVAFSFAARACGLRKGKLPRFSATLALVLLSAAAAIAGPVPTYTGKVLDESTRAPLENAIVTLGDVTVRTTSDGAFEISGPGDSIGFRAYGYMRQSLPVAEFKTGPRDVTLAAIRPKGLYLSFYGIGSAKLREPALKILQQKQLNAVVVDIKSDRGMVPYRTSIPLVKKIGAAHITTVSDPKGLLSRLHREHLYLAARIVVFKDDLLARARPELAVHRKDGSVFTDQEGSGWVDPFSKDAWDYNIAIAVEAAQLGFDEIQFDYIRFPDETGLVFSKPDTMETRLAAITGFLSEARKQLTPYNVFLAADVFGYVMWNSNDTHIGQRLGELASVVDYISPMLYPSSFQFGLPGYPVPVEHPYEIVFRSLQNGQEKAGIPSIRFRPWLQAFRDYAFDRRAYGPAEIEAQIQAAETFGANGWMLWNPRNLYSAEGLENGSRPAGKPRPNEKASK